MPQRVTAGAPASVLEAENKKLEGATSCESVIILK